MIDHLKKGDMANEAERLLEDASWLPEPMRTPELLDAPADDPAAEIDAAELPAFLDDEVQPVDVDDDDGEAVAAAAGCLGGAVSAVPSIPSSTLRARRISRRDRKSVV